MFVVKQNAQNVKKNQNNYERKEKLAANCQRLGACSLNLFDLLSHF